MAKNVERFHGVEAREESIVNDKIKDVRTVSQKISDWFKSPESAIFLFLYAFVIVVYPGLIFEITILSYFFYKKRKDLYEPLAFRKPQTSFEPDPNLPRYDPKAPMPMSEGISFFGNDRVSKKEVWLTNSDVRTHILIFGTTGAGKTETLIGMVFNSLVQASGFIYVDGKGDNSLFLKIFSICRRMGREDDLLLINYMTAGKSETKTTERMSNTTNPFSEGDSDNLSELIVSLMPDSGGDGMWKGRAAIFMSSLMRALVALRNDNKLFLNVQSIRSFFPLNKVIELTLREDIKPLLLDGLRDYVTNLPGYQVNLADYENITDLSEKAMAIAKAQSEDVWSQHGFITMQFTETFGLLSDTYGYIMKTQLGEVDFYDVVVNRRILVVLLPALEKSEQNLGNLGKIIVSSVKLMMSETLGSKVEGDKADVIDAKPTNAPSPYVTVFDEYGYYAVKGAAVMPAQARGLGFSMIFAGQDYQAFKKSSPEEAASIVANCALKICMKLEDPTETLEIFTKASGEAQVSTLSGYRARAGELGMNYEDSDQISFEKASRISVRDLKSQEPGEAHMLFGDRLVRAKMFYANPEQAKRQRLNKFLKIEPPDFEEVARLKAMFKKTKATFNKNVKDFDEHKVFVHEYINTLSNQGDLTELFNIFKKAKAKKIPYKIAMQFSILKYYFQTESSYSDIQKELDMLNKSKVKDVEEEIKEEDSMLDRFSSLSVFGVNKNNVKEVISSKEKVINKVAYPNKDSETDKVIKAEEEMIDLLDEYILDDVETFDSSDKEEDVIDNIINSMIETEE